MAKAESSNFFVINLIIRKANENGDLSAEQYSNIFGEFYLYKGLHYF